MAQQKGKGPQSRAPLKWGEGAKNPTANRHHGCLTMPYVKMGCWNVRTLNQKGKLENAKREMERYGLSVLGLSEVRWKEKGDIVSGDVRVIYSGGDKCEKGVAVMLNKEWANRVIAVEQKNDRLMWIKLNNEPRNIVIV